MNQKKCKALRKIVKSSSLTKETAYVVLRSSSQTKRQFTLAKGCQREAYQTIKKSHKK